MNLRFFRLLARISPELRGETHSKFTSSSTPESKEKDVTIPALATDLMRAVTFPYKTERVEVIVVPFDSGVKDRVRDEFPVVEFAVKNPRVELPKNTLLSTNQSIDEASPFQVEEFCSMRFADQVLREYYEDQTS